MFKVVRFLVSLTTVLAIAVMAMLIMPDGAVGADRTTVRGSAEDVYTFGRDTVITAPVAGSVQVWAGSAEVAAPIDGDLLVFGGTILFRGAGRVRGNVIYAGGNVTGAEGRVGGRLYPLASLEGATASLAKKAIVLSLLFVWLVAAVVVTLMSGREIRSSSIEVRSSALHCFALGLVALTSFVLTALIFSYLIPFMIGIPLLAGLAVFAMLTKIYGMIVVFHAVGTLIAGSRTRDQLASRKWLRGDMAMVVVGLLILGAIRMIPVVGAVVWGVASVFGVGVALATKFGRREPWFLAWRPAEA